MVSALGIMCVAGGIGVAIVIWGLDEQSTPIIATLLVTLGSAIATSIAAIKSTEAADTAAESNKLAHLTASQSAAVQQAVQTHIGHMCPRDDCPFRIPGARIALLEGEIP